MEGSKMSEKQDTFFTELVASSKKKVYTQEEIDTIQQQSDEVLPPELPVITTPLPTYFFSGMWIRFFAFMIDLIVIAALTQVVRTIVGLFITFTQLGTWSVYGICGLIVYYGYFILLTKLNHGQTLGKMIFGIRVVSLTSPVLDWQTVLLREGCGRFFLSIPVLGLFLYVPILFTARKQQVADLFFDTSVVNLKVVAAFLHQTTESYHVEPVYKEVKS